MPRQFLNPAPVLHDILGISPAFNGSLTFYEIGTTTPKDTWSDHDQTILNQNPVPLDSSARTDTQVWGEGEYTVVLRNEAGEVVWTRDWRPEQAGSDALPAKESGKFLTTDGSQWLLEEILQVPDPTGFIGRILSTDGENLLWVPMPEMPEPPEPPEPDIVVTESGNTLSSFQAGIASNPGKFFMQVGSDTAPASGANITSTSVTFPVPFVGTPFVFVIPTVAAAGSGGFLPTPSVQSKSLTGFNVKFDTNGGSASNSNITNQVTFDWMAIGIRDVS